MSDLVKNFYVNSAVPSSIAYNNKDVKSVYYNGTKVWESFVWSGWDNASWEDIYNLCKAKQEGAITEWPSDIVWGMTKTVNLSTAVLGAASFDVMLVGIDYFGDGILTFHSKNCLPEATYWNIDDAHYESLGFGRDAGGGDYNLFTNGDYDDWHSADALTLLNQISSYGNLINYAPLTQRKYSFVEQVSVDTGLGYNRIEYEVNYYDYTQYKFNRCFLPTLADLTALYPTVDSRKKDKTYWIHNQYDGLTKYAISNTNGQTTTIKSYGESYTAGLAPMFNVGSGNHIYTS